MPKKILLVDDNTELQNLVKTYLERRGFQVNAVGDGWNCITEVKERRPDLILLDYDMPKMDGVATLQMLISFNLMKNLPVIMLTGQNDKDIILKTAQLGVADYIVKPFNIKDLMDRVKKQTLTFDYETVKKTVSLLKLPINDYSQVSQLAELNEPKWSVYLSEEDGVEICVLVEKSVSLGRAQVLAEDRMTDLVRIYVRKGKGWRKAFPLPHEAKAA